MSNVDWIAWISIVSSWATVGAIFVARNWLKARIEKGIQHSFDNKLENLRVQLHKQEEQFKSDLRDKEAEISILRNSVLTGSASRQSLLDKRRFESVEKVWTAVNDLIPLKAISAMMAVLNFDAVAKRASEPKMQQFLGVIGNVAPDPKQFKNLAVNERPFLPELAWAYFSAYTTIVMASYLRLQVLRIGVDEPGKLLSKDSVQKILKTVLPHQSNFIEQNEPEAYYHLLDEIEGSLLAELRKILEGKEADQAATARAKEIMDAVNTANAERARNAFGGIEGAG